MRYGWVLAAALAVPSVLGAQDIGLPIGTKAPAVAVEDLDGKPVDLGVYVGKQPVLLEFWATWCPLCNALEPALNPVFRHALNLEGAASISDPLALTRAYAARFAALIPAGPEPIMAI